MKVFHSDNLTILRDMQSECVDLVYLDPPFNSNRDYLFKNGEVAFTDTWKWTRARQREYDDLPENIARFLECVNEDRLSYLTFMSVRLIELFRVLKKSGSLYLHCDPNTSHYLKILLDELGQFRTEINWRRTPPKSLGNKNHANCRDVILLYAGSDNTYNNQYVQHDESYIKKFFRHEDAKGRYSLVSLTNPNPDRPNLHYEFLGVTRTWRWTQARMMKAFKEGIVIQTGEGTVPRNKKYLHELPGRIVTNDWQDIQPVARPEYPTQKPDALLERIIRTSSEENDIVLDPFCGSGTTLVVAKKLGRRYIGIDMSEKAIGIAKRRLIEQRTA